MRHTPSSSCPLSRRARGATSTPPRPPAPYWPRPPCYIPGGAFQVRFLGMVHRDVCRRRFQAKFPWDYFKQRFRGGYIQQSFPKNVLQTTFRRENFMEGFQGRFPRTIPGGGIQARLMVENCKGGAGRCGEVRGGAWQISRVRT